MTASPSPARPLTPLEVVALACGVGVAVWIAIAWSRGTAGLEAVWISNGLVAGILLPRARREWPVLIAVTMVSEFIVRTLHGDPYAQAAIQVAANALEILIVAGGIRHWIPDPGSTYRVTALTVAATASTFVACAVSGVLPARFMADGGAAGFWKIWALWFSVHVVGIVLMATLVTVAARVGMRLFGRRGRRVDYALCQSILILTCALVFLQTSAPLLFLVFPPLVMLTFRHGFPGAITGVVVIAAAGTAAALAGGGPFAFVQEKSIHFQVLLGQLFVATACLVSMPIATVLTARRRLARELKNSEADYRLLADNTRDLVMRMRADGSYSYVSRSVTELLGWTRDEFIARRSHLLHPDDDDAIMRALQALFESGETSTQLFRLHHADGRWIWIEAITARIEHPGPDPIVEVVLSGRDVTARVAAQHALDESRRRLQTITNTLPALVSYIDRDERYTFANMHHQRLLGIAPESLLGRTLQWSHGGHAADQWAPHIRGALAGEPQVFEVEPCEATGGLHLQCHYIPDVAPDLSVRGFHEFTFDISELKSAEKALTRLARVDPLTGLGNRRQLNERLEAAILRARRRRQPLVLLYLDVDHFKEINDGLGHLAGDAVLRIFAERVQACVYEVDVVARLGGDEFVILVEDAPSVEATEIIARKIVAAMHAPIRFDDHSIEVTTSVGVAFSNRPVSIDQMLALADGALYAAKAAGRDTFRIAIDAALANPRSEPAYPGSSRSAD